MYSVAVALESNSCFRSARTVSSTRLPTRPPPPFPSFCYVCLLQWAPVPTPLTAPPLHSPCPSPHPHPPTTYFSRSGCVVLWDQRYLLFIETADGKEEWQRLGKGSPPSATVLRHFTPLDRGSLTPTHPAQSGEFAPFATHWLTTRILALIKARRGLLAACN